MKAEELGRIEWNGENTKEVVDFCVKNDGSLCHIYKVDDNYLSVEPGDTMRCSSMYVPIRGTIVAYKDGWRRYVRSKEGR